MASQEQVNKMQALFDLITELDIPHLIYDKDWGSINFEVAKTDLERLYAICNHFKVLPVDQLPSDIADQIVTEATPISQTVNKIREYSIEQANPSGIRDQIIREVQANVDRFYKSAHIYVPYLAYQKGEIQNNIQQLTASVEEARSLMKESGEDVKTKSEEIDKIIQAAREASSSVGVAHFTADFISEAEVMENQATVLV